ncbi:helix-turn-helix domain-containing protein [Rummeliibacillus stabekisii]|uniref:helix-turn-helix domain-containing protein n=1 Tax=Rummeliibacillus stabekisii TaxID=241244 RepID=UPI0037177749
MALGERLKKARNLKKLTQMDAAKKLGITNGALSGYERNYRDPDTEMLKKIADLYDVSSEWLLGRSENMQKQFNENVLSTKDEKDVAKTLDIVKGQLERQLKGEKGPSGNDSAVSFHGEPMSDEAIESLLSAIEFAERTAKVINKKYTPNKYKKNNNDNIDI